MSSSAARLSSSVDLVEVQIGPLAAESEAVEKKRWRLMEELAVMRTAVEKARLDLDKLNALAVAGDEMIATARSREMRFRGMMEGSRNDLETFLPPALLAQYAEPAAERPWADQIRN